MADTESRHVIKYVLELDDSDIEQQIKDKGHTLEGKSPRESTTPKDSEKLSEKPVTKDGQKKAEPLKDPTIGEEFGKKLAEAFGKFLPENLAKHISGMLRNIVERIPGVSSVMDTTRSHIASMFGKSVMAPKGGGGPPEGTAAAEASGEGGESAAAAGGAGSALGIGLAVAAVVAAMVVLTTIVMPRIIATFGQWSVATTGAGIELAMSMNLLKFRIAQELTPAMVGWISIQQDLVKVVAKNMWIFRSLNDVLVTFEGVIKALIGVIEVVAKVGKVSNKIWDWTGGTVVDAPIKLWGAAAKGFNWVGEKTGWWGGGDSGAGSANSAFDNEAAQLNRAFLNSLNFGKAPGGKPQAGGPAQQTSGGSRSAPGSSSTYQTPHAQVASISTTFNVDNDIKIMHEQAVKDGIEKIKDRILAAVKVTRDETRLFAMLLDGRSSSNLM